MGWMTAEAFLGLAEGLDHFAKRSEEAMG